jgi:L-fuculose-phosphate aldolase
VTRRKLDRAIVDIARALPARGLVVGSAGNVSARHAGAVRITPTRIAYATMRRSHLVTVDLRTDRADPRASLEWPLHAAIYRARPDVQAVVHAHGPWATAWSCLAEPVLPELEESTYYGIGPVRTAPQAPGGSARLATLASAALGTSRAVLLAGHGLVATAETPAMALTIAEAVEHQCRVAWLVRVATSNRPIALAEPSPTAALAEGR